MTVLSPAELKILSELENKARTPWQSNGYRDGLTGRDDRIPYGRMSVRDSYMIGWRDGQQVRALKVAAKDALDAAFDHEFIGAGRMFVKPRRSS